MSEPPATGLENPTTPVLERISEAPAYDLQEFFDPSEVRKPVDPLRKGRKPSVLPGIR